MMNVYYLLSVYYFIGDLLMCVRRKVRDGCVFHHLCCVL